MAEGIQVTKERAEKAKAAISRALQVVEDVALLEVLDELNLSWAASYSDSGKVQVLLTDLQMVAVSAALWAAIECRLEGARQRQVDVSCA